MDALGQNRPLGLGGERGWQGDEALKEGADVLGFLVKEVCYIDRDFLLGLPGVTWGYLCANGRTGHAVGVALVLSDVPFNLKLAITVTRVSADPVCHVLCLGPCIGRLVHACLLYTSPSPRD